MQVSIIIPVYNAGQYLEECLEHVCRQTLREWEVICVDDGSTDDSLAIMQRYEEKDKRVKIVRQINSGPGPARNRGLQEAAGEFVIFLDADDFYMDIDALEQMYTACKFYHVNVCGSAMKYLRNGVIADDSTLKDVKMAAKENKILAYQDFQFDYGFTGFLFSKKMLIEENISFPAYRRYQDPCFFVRAMYAAKQFIFSDTSLYVCRVPAMASRFSKDKVYDLIMGLSDNMSFACKKKLDKLFRTSLMRLEYEYYSVICHFVNIEDKRHLSLLWEINDMVRNVLSKPDYMVRPLQFLLEEDTDFYLHYECDLLEKIRSLPDIYLYGAGGMARKFIQYVRREGLQDKIRGIIVSKRAEDNKSLEGIPIYSVDELELDADATIFVAVGAVFHQEILDNLDRNGLYYRIILDSIFLEELPEREG